MGVHHRLLTWCFIFQLLLLFIAVIEASRNIEVSDLDLKDRVSKIEAKDWYQDGEMALLKNALNDERKLVHDLTNRVAILEDSNKKSARQKRPYRLLPPHIPPGPEENEMDADNDSQIRFYGPATGCNDLGRLGYTLNGFYLVQEQNSHQTNGSSRNNRQFEIVECRFMHHLKSGNQNPVDKEKRLGFIRINNDNKNSNRPLFRSDVKEDFNPKEISNKKMELKLTRTNNGNDYNNIQPSRSGGKGDLDLKEVEDKEEGLKFTTRNNKIKSSGTTQPRFDGKQNCLYKLRSQAHEFITPKKLTNMCLVAEKRTIKNNESIITTNEPEYYLAQLSCDSVKDEEHWTRRNKHICSNNNDMCLTVSTNKKDGRVFVNLMEYEESAKTQQWTVIEYYDTRVTKQLVTMTNVGTSLCLFEPMDNRGKRKAITTVKACPTSYTHLEYLFYFEKVNLTNRKNCPPFNAEKLEQKTYSEMFKNLFGK